MVGGGVKWVKEGKERRRKKRKDTERERETGQKDNGRERND